MEEKPTIKDIARMLELAPSTVSYAINGGPRRVNKKTRERVMALVRELNYHPNANARNLITKRARTFGIVFRNLHHLMLDNPFVTSVMAGITESARNLEYDVLLLHASSDEIKSETALRHILSGRVDGLLFIAPYSDSPVLKALAERSLPFVVISSIFSAPCASSVIVNNRQGAEMVMDHLFSLGHRAVGFMDGRSRHIEACARHGVYVQRMEEAGCEVLPHWVQCGLFEYQPAYEAAHRMLAASRRPTAVFAANDLMAFGVMDAAIKSGLRIPEDLSVVGFDDIPPAAWNRPALTTVRQPMYELGAQAARLLVEQVDNGAEAQEIVLDAELIIRDSSALPGLNA